MAGSGLTAARGAQCALARPAGGSDLSATHTRQRLDDLARGLHVPRARLLESLPSVGETGLVVVTAPHGYGKTVLLEQWVRREACAVAWLTLTRAHDDVVAFRAGLAAALEPITGSEPASTVTLVNTLERQARSTAIVVDDVHTVTDPEVHAALWQLVRHCPQHVTVALASRQALPLPISRLETAGAVVRVGIEDLAFTADEVETLVRGIVDDTGVAVEAGTLHATTGGWPAAAVAAASAIAAGDRMDRDEDVVSLLQDHGTLDRVLADVHPDLVGFLEQTAHLDELDPHLCSTVTGDASAAERLRALAGRHHLIVPRAAAYEHRPLLGALIRRAVEQRDDASIRQRHRRAATWYLDQGRAARALEHAAAAGDHSLVNRARDPAVRDAASTANSDVLARWSPSVADADDLAGTSDAALLAVALLPRSRPARLHASRGPARGRVRARTLAAVDLVRAGRCHDALQMVADTRQLIAHASVAASQVTHALLWLAGTESRLLLDVGAGPDDVVVPRDADGGTWPWLTLWAYGMQAVAALAEGNDGLATAMLRHARHRVGRLHPSWRQLDRGFLAVAEALSESPGVKGRSQDPRDHVRTLDALVSRADRIGDAPIGIMARHALYDLHTRRGEVAAATRRLAEADASRARHHGLPLLSRLRTRLVGADDAETAPRTPEPLSPRERTILRHLDSDRTLAQIADDLFVSVHTVRAHTRSIYRKLGVSNRAQAVAAHASPG